MHEGAAVAENELELVQRYMKGSVIWVKPWTTKATRPNSLLTKEELIAQRKDVSVVLQHLVEDSFTSVLVVE